MQVGRKVEEGKRPPQTEPIYYLSSWHLRSAPQSAACYALLSFSPHRICVSLKYSVLSWKFICNSIAGFFFFFSLSLSTLPPPLPNFPFGGAMPEPPAKPCHFEKGSDSFKNAGMLKRKINPPPPCSKRLGEAWQSRHLLWGGGCLGLFSWGKKKNNKKK